MYTLLNNAEASKFDLYLLGRLVASLHYKIEEDRNEVMLIYCEAIEARIPEDHCRELMKRALDDLRNRRMTVTITCPIALEIVRAGADGSITA